MSLIRAAWLLCLMYSEEILILFCEILCILILSYITNYVILNIHNTKFYTRILKIYSFLISFFILYNHHLKIFYFYDILIFSAIMYYVLLLISLICHIIKHYKIIIITYIIVVYVTLHITYLILVQLKIEISNYLTNTIFSIH